MTTTPDSVATVTLSPSVKVMRIGESLQLSATLRDSTDHVLAPRPVEWVVNGAPGNNAATVSPTGLVTAVATGTVIVEAFSEGQHGSMTIIIGDNVDENIVVTFAAPVENELVGDSLIIRVGVQSSRPLSSVTASVGSLHITLIPTPVGALGLSELWGGTIVTPDLPTGPYGVGDSHRCHWRARTWFAAVSARHANGQGRQWKPAEAEVGARVAKEVWHSQFRR